MSSQHGRACGPAGRDPAKRLTALTPTAPLGAVAAGIGAPPLENTH
ncbi:MULTISPECIES: hypothetical protein [unclassified Streptomyces]